MRPFPVLAATLALAPAMAAGDVMTYGPVEPPPRFDGTESWARSRNAETGMGAGANAVPLPPEWLRALVAAGLLGAADERGRYRVRPHDEGDFPDSDGR